VDKLFYFGYLFVQSWQDCSWTCCYPTSLTKYLPPSGSKTLFSSFFQNLVAWNYCSKRMCWWWVMKNNIMVIDHMDHKYLGGGSICFG